MNTESRNHLTEMLHLRNDAPALAASPRAANAGTMPVPPLDDTLAERVAEFMREGAELAPALEERLDALQEGFVSQLERQFEKERFSPANRLHIFFSPEGKLVVEGADDDADKVCAIFSRNPALQRRFGELARLALLTHGISVARRAHEALETAGGAEEEPLLARYHMCLKGALSHFYVR